MANHNTPEELKYTIEHEWSQIENEVATIGITDFAQSSLGDIVFLELPEIGRQIEKGESFGVIESIKSVSDLYSPLSGQIIEINTDLEDSPENFNTSPYESWIIKIKLKTISEVDDLLDAKKYNSFCETL